MLLGVTAKGLLHCVTFFVTFFVAAFAAALTGDSDAAFVAAFFEAREVSAGLAVLALGTPVLRSGLTNFVRRARSASAAAAMESGCGPA